MSELQRQQQKIRERREALYGKPKVVNVSAGKNISLNMVDVSDILDSDINTVNKAKAIVRRLSHHTPYSYEEITSERINKKIKFHRNDIMREVKRLLPHINFYKMGEIFNRDYSTIQHALGTIPKGRFYKEKIERQIARKKEMKSFVLLKCEEYGIDYETFISRTRGESMEKRKRIYAEALSEFSELYMSDTSEVFQRSIASIVRYKEELLK